MKLRTNFCTRLLLFLDEVSTRKELRDINPGTPQPTPCSKSKKKILFVLAKNYVFSKLRVAWQRVSSRRFRLPLSDHVEIYSILVRFGSTYISRRFSVPFFLVIGQHYFRSTFFFYFFLLFCCIDGRVECLFLQTLTVLLRSSATIFQILFPIVAIYSHQNPVCGHW